MSRELVSPEPVAGTGSGPTVSERSPIDRSARRPAPGPGATVGRYVILKPIGEGGMGTVVLAYDPELDRKVALKFLHDAPIAGLHQREGQQRLLREAQAVARLTHPNVIAVHDVGRHDDRVFIALEYVEGATLHDWLKAQPRSPRDILVAYLAAARGLAAAHHAGLVHRDFKPDNVLVGADGRPRVTDFGLARLAREPVADGPTTTSPTAASADETPSGPLSIPLTRYGVVMGTPGYMAPELYEGAPADARSDQFSFCAALYAALYGVKAFAGKTAEEIAAQARAGTLNPPAHRDVPAWLRPIVVRGLSVDPSARHRSMDELIDALSKDPAARRRAVALGLTALAVLSGGVALGWPRHAVPVELCTGAERGLVGVWDEPSRAAITQRFTEVGGEQAARSLPIVATVLGGFRTRWVQQFTSACEATRVQKTQSEQMMTLQMVCLQRQAQEARALCDQFARATEQVVMRAPPAVNALERPEGCGDLEALRAPTPLPTVPERRTEVEASYSKLAEAQALRITGQYQASVTLAEAELETASKLGYRPLEAQAYEKLARAYAKQGEPSKAYQSGLRALWAAEAGGDERTRLAALGALIGATDDLSRFEEGQRYFEQAMAILERRDEPNLRALVLSNFASSLGSSGEPAECERRYLEAMELGARLAFDDPNQSVYETGLANCQRRQGKYAEAMAHNDHAIANTIRIMGPDHPILSEFLVNRAVIFGDMGQSSRALETMNEVLARNVRALGPDNSRWHGLQEIIASHLIELGRSAEALALTEREQPLLEKLFGEDSVEAATMLGNRVSALHTLGRYAAAAPFRRRFLARAEKVYGAGKGGHLGASDLEADALAAAGRHREALAMYRAILPFATQYQSFRVALETKIGLSLLSLGRQAEATLELRRALADCLGTAWNPVRCGQTRLALARGLAATRPTDPEVPTLVAAARADFQSTDAAEAGLKLAELERWWAKAKR